jgi:hypothetical protein
MSQTRRLAGILAADVAGYSRVGQRTGTDEVPVLSCILGWLLAEAAFRGTSASACHPSV